MNLLVEYILSTLILNEIFDMAMQFCIAYNTVTLCIVCCVFIVHRVHYVSKWKQSNWFAGKQSATLSICISKKCDKVFLYSFFLYKSQLNVLAPIKYGSMPLIN